MRKLWGMLLTAAILCGLLGCSGGNAEPSSSEISGSLATQQAESSIDAAAPSGTPSLSASSDAEEPGASAEPGLGASPDAPAQSVQPVDPVDPAQSPATAPAKPTAPKPGKPAPSSAPGKPGKIPSAEATPSPSPPAASSSPEGSKPVIEEVTLSITGNAEWGTILSSLTVVLKDGDTVADVLKRGAKARKLAYEIRGTGAMTYIEGIDGLFEFDDGPTSGWKYRVNGTVPDIGAGSYKLKPGDRLEWFYTSADQAAEEDKGSGS